MGLSLVHGQAARYRQIFLNAYPKLNKLVMKRLVILTKYFFSCRKAKNFDCFITGIIGNNNRRETR